jgi:isopentenyldiphosphate isomerase
MSEVVKTYKLDDLDQPIPMDRKEFYDEQVKVFKKTGKTSKAIEVVQVLLFTTDKEVILQKRSNTKYHNPSFLDKTMGGHVKFGDSLTYTVMVESLQEVSVPSIVLNTNEDFVKTYKLLDNQLENLAVIEYIDSRTYNSKKMINDEEILIADKYHFYLGVYNGSLKPSDKEAAGLIYFKYDEFEKELSKAPGMFTEDLKFFLREYHSEIDKFLDNLG